jgi:hypothetical protein
MMFAHRPAWIAAALIIGLLDDSEMERRISMAVVMQAHFNVLHVLGVGAKARIICYTLTETRIVWTLPHYLPPCNW